jgi:hypothetical protein
VSATLCQTKGINTRLGLMVKEDSGRRRRNVQGIQDLADGLAWQAIIELFVSLAQC